MVYLMTLVIVGATNTDITVVNSPVAHKRGGASPNPRAFLLYRLHFDCGNYFLTHGESEFTTESDHEEGYSRKLPPRLAVVSGDNTKAPCGAVVSRMMLAVSGMQP
jgi:hypothetical protein